MRAGAGTAEVSGAEPAAVSSGHGIDTAAATRLTQRMDEAMRKDLDQAMPDDDRSADETLLYEHPDLISTPVRSRNWGPPLSSAAILGKLDMVETLMRLEPADVEHALGRLCLPGPLIRPTIQYSNR